MQSCCFALLNLQLFFDISVSVAVFVTTAYKIWKEENSFFSDAFAAVVVVVV